MSDWSAEAIQFKNQLLEMSKQPGNNECADCTAKAPRWASFNFGVFLCLKCAGIHRGYGRDISKVKSITLDKWVPNEFAQMIGNVRANSILLYNLPSGLTKPNENDDAARIKWLENKYIKKRWMRRPDQPPSVGAEVVQVPQIQQPAQQMYPQQQVFSQPIQQQPQAQQLQLFAQQNNMEPVFPTFSSQMQAPVETPKPAVQQQQQIQVPTFSDFFDEKPMAKQPSKNINSNNNDIFADMFSNYSKPASTSLVVQTAPIAPVVPGTTQQNMQTAAMRQSQTKSQSSLLDFFDISTSAPTESIQQQTQPNLTKNTANILDLFDLAAPTVRTEVPTPKNNRQPISATASKSAGLSFFDFSNTQTVVPSITDNSSGYRPANSYTFL